MMLEHLDIDMQKINLDPYIKPQIKINPKWTMDLTVK